MRYREIKQLNKRLSHICFGTLTMGPLCADLPVEQGAALIRRAIDAGITHFDTAQQYINYQYLSAALTPQDDTIIISTKSYADTYDEMARAVEEARLAFRRNALDIFLMHELRPDDAFAERAEGWEYLKTAKSNGIVRMIGISTHHVDVVREAAARDDVDVIHAMLNAEGVGIRGGSRDEMMAALQEAHDKGKLIYGMKAIGGGSLMSRAETSLKWAFSQEYLDAVAIGIKSEAELLTNIAWEEGRVADRTGEIPLQDRNMVFDKEPACHRCGACVARCHQQALQLGEDGVEWDKSKCLYCGYCIAACPWFCISFC